MTNFDAIATAQELSPTIRELGVAKVSEGAGLSQPTLYLWMDGRRVLSLEARLRVAEACGFRIAVSVKPPRRYGPKVGATALESPAAPAVCPAARSDPVEPRRSNL